MTTSQYTALDNRLPVVEATDLVTAGSLQLVVACPWCQHQHRHLGLGLRRSPCGHPYLVTRTNPVAKLTAV